MRKKIVAGNWKMNNNKRETAELIQALKPLSFSTDVRVMIAPAFAHLARRRIDSRRTIEVLAQNMNARFGGFYGRNFRKDAPQYRHQQSYFGSFRTKGYYKQTDADSRKKSKQRLSRYGSCFCFGEELDQRKKGSF